MYKRKKQKKEEEKKKENKCLTSVKENILTALNKEFLVNGNFFLLGKNCVPSARLYALCKPVGTEQCRGFRYQYLCV